MKFKHVLLAFLSLASTPGFSKTPEQWICVNARDVGGLYSLEVQAVTSAGDQAWRSLDVFLVKNNRQSLGDLETYSYPPAYTSAGGNSDEVIVEGRNRKFLGRVNAALTVKLARQRRAPFSSYILSLTGSVIRGATTVWEGVLDLAVGSSADGRSIPMNCTAIPK